MGIFTWTDASVKPKKNRYGDYRRKDKVEYGGYAKLICPDNTEIETECHDCYGNIGGKDIYDLVAEWNRFHISADNLDKKPDDPSKYGGLWEYEKDKLREEGKTEEEISRLSDKKRMEYFNADVKRWEIMAACIDEYKAGASDSDLAAKYGPEWKRNVGIAISCSDENMRKLKYPIKLTKNRDAHGYDTLLISYCCQ